MERRWRRRIDSVLEVAEEQGEATVEIRVWVSGRVCVLGRVCVKVDIKLRRAWLGMREG